MGVGGESTVSFWAGISPALSLPLGNLLEQCLERKKMILLVRSPLPWGFVTAWEGPRACKWLKKNQIAEENHFSYSIHVIWAKRVMFWTWLGTAVAEPKFAADPDITSSGSRQNLEQGRASNTSSEILERQQLCLCISWQKIPLCEKICHSPTMAWVGKKKILTGEVLSAVFPV